jgi:hypothetical protein
LQPVICWGYPISGGKLNSRSAKCHFSICTWIRYCLMRVLPNWLTIHVLSWLNTHALWRRLNTCILTNWLASSSSTWFTFKMFPRLRQTYQPSSVGSYLKMQYCA